MTLTIAELLDGTRPGQPQSVGRMQVIPLVTDHHQDQDGGRFVAPPACRTSTLAYGTLAFDNPHDAVLLVPCHAGFVVPQAAQDHAMAHAALVAPKTSVAFDTALCVQETQGGTITAAEHQMLILPFPLRGPALAVRHQRDYSRLWPAIRALNDGVGLGLRGNLIVFLRQFALELDRFVAEFECLDGQVGAIVLVDGQVLGVERTPTAAYWQALWAPLLRGCYGAEVVRRQQADGAASGPPPGRVPLDPAGAATLDELTAALRRADQAEQALAAACVAELSSLPLDASAEPPAAAVAAARVETVRGGRFEGQLVRDDQRVVYASLVARGR
jgi:hypothetical protein